MHFHFPSEVPHTGSEGTGQDLRSRGHQVTPRFHLSPALPAGFSLPLLRLELLCHMRCPPAGMPADTGTMSVCVLDPLVCTGGMGRCHSCVVCKPRWGKSGLTAAAEHLWQWTREGSVTGNDIWHTA